ncbi:MAG: amidohydrolase family protein [Candidatus Binatia bacterium]
MFNHPVISADGHIDLPWLPPTLFTNNAPAVLKSKMPKVVDNADGKMWVAHNGTNLGLAGGMGSAGRPYIPGQIYRSDRMAAEGLYEDYKRGIFRTSDPKYRLLDQDRDGVVGEVLYGILGAAFRLQDPEIVETVVRIYNDFAADFSKACPERLATIACLPTFSPEKAGAELRRCAKMGIKGAEIPISPGMMPLWHHDWNPLWEAASDCGIPMHFHTLGPKQDMTWLSDHRSRRMWLATLLAGFQMSMVEAMAAIIYSGALERLPNLKIVIGEAGIGWIPYVLERLDYEWEDQFKDLELKMPPSQYWYRQMYATYQQDQAGIDQIEKVGVNNVMWGSDFPHPDGVWPDSQEFLHKQLGHLPEATRCKIVYENAAKLYGFPMQN